MDLITNVYIAAGQPHFYLAPEKNPRWAELREAYVQAGEEIAKSDAELILVYSTQWFSVIGHLFQVDPKPSWTLVDQNWYEYGEIPYELRVDPAFGELYCELAREKGMQASTVHYRGFPVDTGTVVAMKLLNPGNAKPISIVSCNIYAEREETRRLGALGREAIRQYGRKVAVVLVSNLSNRYHVTEIDPAEDRISSQKDHEWNEKMLEILGDGRLQEATEVVRQFADEANADMGFKGLWWLGAVAGETNRFRGKVHGYAPVWGTGAALIELTPTDEPREFEKEYDELSLEELAAAETEAPQSTGLSTHNVTAFRPGPAAVPDPPAERQSSGRVTSTRAPKPVGAYPHARRIGSMLFLSGIGPRDPVTNEVPGNVMDDNGKLVSYDLEQQARAVIANLERVLEEAGSSVEKLVDVTVFLTDMEKDFQTFNDVWAERFGADPPARTTVGVDSLPTPIAIEFKAIAEA